MTTRSTQPPWEFLLSASRSSLQSFELSRLSHAANIRKEISALLDQWLEENAAALLAVPNVNGALVGGASLDAEDFMGIARAVRPDG